MFTGIIETTGIVKSIVEEGSNAHIRIESTVSDELKIDQSLSHNGVCLTVVEVKNNQHVVTAIEETLQRSNLGDLKAGDAVNLERAMRADSRLDGHLVQGHVDTTAECVKRDKREGSWYFHFRYPTNQENLLVDKGSICINGVSLTVIEPSENQFSVAIIPYTYEHTNFQSLKPGERVNLEFDILGKYIARYAQLYMGKGR